MFIKYSEAIYTYKQNTINRHPMLQIAVSVYIRVWCHISSITFMHLFFWDQVDYLFVIKSIGPTRVAGL